MSPLRRPAIVLTSMLLTTGFIAWFALAWLERHHRDQADDCSGVKASLIEGGLDDQADDDRINSTFINPSLYIGGYASAPPTGTGAVLNLCETEDRYHCTVHRWEPIRDAAPAPDLDWLRRMVQFIDAQRRNGRVVFVHCRAGVSRSGMVVVAYLMFEHGWTRDEALAFVRTKRPLVRPNVVFMERLVEWEAALAAERDK